MKRQNPFIFLLSEGKKLRENAQSNNYNFETSGEEDPEISEEEYLQKLKEIRMMNARERKRLYEKYGKVRSSLQAAISLNNSEIISGDSKTKPESLSNKTRTKLLQIPGEGKTLDFHPRARSAREVYKLLCCCCPFS